MRITLIKIINLTEGKDFDEAINEIHTTLYNHYSEYPFFVVLYVAPNHKHLERMVYVP
jgi:hypothetical protein